MHHESVSLTTSMHCITCNIHNVAKRVSSYSDERMSASKNLQMPYKKSYFIYLLLHLMGAFPSFSFPLEERPHSPYNIADGFVASQIAIRSSSRGRDCPQDTRWSEELKTPQNSSDSRHIPRDILARCRNFLLGCGATHDLHFS